MGRGNDRTGRDRIGAYRVPTQVSEELLTVEESACQRHPRFSLDKFQSKGKELTLSIKGRSDGRYNVDYIGFGGERGCGD